tara:strand:+ start:334 stop:618 length:285 start_codon:yes stop_codon:yes gene_type:complete
MGRPTKAKAVRREALREELKAREYLRQLDIVDGELSDNWNSLSSENIAALRLKVDLNLKRLLKVLPDLKSIEHSGDESEPMQVVIKHFSEKLEK